MDYESFLSEIYTPLIAIEILSDIIYQKCNDNWNIFSNNVTKESAYELLALNYAVNICAKSLLSMRDNIVSNKFFTEL